MSRDYTVKKALPQNRYGRLTVIGNAKGGWLCRCDCGAEKVVRTQALKSGSTQSCGCYQAAVRTRARSHGMTHDPIYRLWVSMMDRCYRSNVPNFRFYGARGITVCERWHTFQNFHADMGDRPEGTSLDRIDNSRGYEPENCRWSALTAQSRNTRRNRHLTLNGRTATVAEWSEITGLSPQTIASRLRRGKSVEEALQT
jgi:hypothetical protein